MRAMPCIDLPLDQLRQYRGRTPRPADFDAYWARALAELDATPPQPRLAPAWFRTAHADCLDLTFAGVGGAEVYAKLVRPKGRGPFPTVLMFHGYAGNSGQWLDKLAWVNEGWQVLAMDCRGQGGRSHDATAAVRGPSLRGHIVRGLEDHPDRLAFRQIFLDTAQLARVALAMPETDAARLVATGGSQGGALTLACAALEPRVRRIAPVYPFLCDYRRVWEMDLAKDAYQELRDHFRLFDPRHERETELFTRLGYIDCQFLAERIQAETLLVVGLMDPICPPSTQYAAYNRIRAPKQELIYPDYGHEAMPEAPERIFAFLSA